MVQIITAQSGIHAPKSEEMGEVLNAMDDNTDGFISKTEFLDLMTLGVDKMIDMES